MVTPKQISQKEKYKHSSKTLIYFTCTVNRRVKPRGSGGKDRSPTLTVNEFHNIKLICDHFKPALDEWQAAKNVKFPTPEQVMGR